ncbi:PLP-dependent aspartate aminotransferase family protein [Clostridium aestuarii]|uniref:PLP-dependent aspartate aminotransferase family protein n=1 Tax=Clostridium aestuarii TaxID=338193 RepID=A0ABT4CZ59_9CLOT|nr:PLP-dependent aspartate aminotransferase family protein [Clostridium aestuarii]MCY6483410.1 PLP-dependent aspartate aminotransferase family protein [Clostridium aestuarii]
MTNIEKWGENTKAVHVGSKPCPATGALVSPIYQTSTYAYESTEEAGKIFTGEKFGYLYGRDHSPTEIQLEEKIAALEGGEACKVFGSGMAAIANAHMALLKAGDHVICGDVVYGGTYGLFDKMLRPFGVDVTYVDTSKIEELEKALKPNTKVVHIETPANPTLRITDIKEVSKFCKAHNLSLVVDNTFMTPYLQKPLELGADIVVHSATKYLNGHGDCIAGVVVGSKEFIEKGLHEGVTKIGALVSPFTCFLVKRGIQTLPLRMEQHINNAMKVAEYLEAHPKVEKVLYPGLKSFPQHELAKKQMKGFGALISFEVKGGLDKARQLCDNLEMIELAVSLGDVGTLIEHPASMTHKSLPVEERRASGITDGLVRLSIGIENIEDIITDLDQAFDKM